MTNEFLFDAMSEIDFDLIERAEAPVPLRKKPIFRMAMIAASLALFLSLGTVSAGVAGTVAVGVQYEKYVEQNYPEYDGTLLHFAQILLTEDENALSSLLDDDLKHALGGLIEALRENWGGGELTEQSTPMPEEQTTEGGHETDETTQAETETEPEPEYTDKEPDEGWSEGLSYRQRVEDGRIVYVVSGRGDCTDTHVRIPPTYQGCSVTAIDESAFESDSLIVSLSVPSSVAEIGDKAFRDCENLQSVELTKGLGSIGQYAFSDTHALKEIEFPDSLGFIDDGAFLGAGLEQIVLPDSLTHVGQGAFSNCINAKAVKLSEGMTEISAQMFNACKSLTRIEIHDGIEAIRSSAFYECIALEKVILPDRHILIEDSAFAFCSMMSGELQIEIPDAVPDFGERTFDSAYVKVMVFPEGFSEVPARMFHQCIFLESVTLPGSVASIGENAFYLCIRLREIRFVGTSEEWERIKMPDDIREQLTPLVVYVEE